MSLPSGTVTFLFTDIEGSTALAQQFPAELSDLLARHHTILHQAIQAHNGHVYQIIGDAFCAAFYTASEALQAALDAQRGLQHERWDPAPIKARMGIHTGAAQAGVMEERAGGYAGYLTLTRTQRVMSVAYGGQVLLSNPTAELVRGELPIDVSLRDMGEHRLKGLLNPEHLWQLVAPDVRKDFPPLSSLNAIPNNLPAQLTSFIGREREIEEVKNALQTHRLVTLTGSGGTGKTRLSLQVAADLLDAFPDGVWFVELAPLTDPVLIPQTILTRMGLSEQQGKDSSHALYAFLKEKRTLLILDNCEHLIQASAVLADNLLRHAPVLKILASSREALGVEGELAWRVPSLSLPNPKEFPDVAQLTQYEAVRLFIDRAALVNPQFHVTRDNAPAIAQICHRLDGIPLALELAAARVKALSVEQIAARLDDRFRLLTGGARTSLPRQQTLRALIDWSYNLLSENEKTLFRRLAVFVGGWTLDAAENICAGENTESFEVLDLLSNLVDKSLVIPDPVAERIRYHRLETIRQYAREKFFETEQVGIVRQRHADWFVQFALEIAPKLRETDAPQWLDQLESEHDNLRAAFEWLLTTEPNDALRLAASLGHYWLWRDYFSEGRDVLRRALQAAPNAPPELRARALRWEGLMMVNLGDYANARESLLTALALLRTVEDRDTLASTLGALGITLWSQADYAGARGYLEEALNIRRAMGEKALIAGALVNLGNLAHSQGDYLAAKSSHEETLAVFREMGDAHGIINTLNNLGIAVEALGDYDSARRYLEESVAMAKEYKYKTNFAYALNSLAHLQLAQEDIANAKTNYRASLAAFKEVGEKRGLAYCLEGLARVAVAMSKIQATVTLLAAADALRTQIGAPLSEDERAEIDKSQNAAQTQLDAQEFASGWTKGRAMPVDQALEFAMGEV